MVSPQLLSGRLPIPAGWYSILMARASLLLSNERIIFTSSILVRPPTTIHLPSFLLPNPKRRQLILTDFPRLITVKEETNGSLSVKAECVFVVRGSARSASTIGSLGMAGPPDGFSPQPQASASTGSLGGSGSGSGSGGATKVLDVQEKGAKGFAVQTVSLPVFGLLSILSCV